MARRLLLLCLIALVGAGQAFADLPDSTDEMVEHLEFLGYEAELREEEGYLSFGRDDLPTTLLYEYDGGVLLSVYWVLSVGEDDRETVMEAVNELNAGATTARYYLDEDDDLAVEAWFADDYDRREFGRLMELWR
ncbi:MAG: YbjN domain-containing protein, partial [Spirochaetaceae bacterium]